MGKRGARSCWARPARRAGGGRRRRAGLAPKSPGSMKRSWAGGWALKRRGSISKAMQKRILVNGASGFIGGHLIRKFKPGGHWARAVHLKTHDFPTLPAAQFL